MFLSKGAFEDPALYTSWLSSQEAFNLWKSPVPFNKYEKSATVVSNSQALLRPLDNIVGKAWNMFASRWVIKEERLNKSTLSLFISSDKDEQEMSGCVNKCVTPISLFSSVTGRISISTLNLGSQRKTFLTASHLLSKSFPATVNYARNEGEKMTSITSPLDSTREHHYLRLKQNFHALVKKSLDLICSDKDWDYYCKYHWETFTAFSILIN